MYMTLDEFNKLKWDIEIYLIEQSNEKRREAIRNMANIFDSGTYIEIKRDLIKAYKLYHEGAELGDIHCMRTLGNAYMEGYNHIEKDIDKAIYWFQKAAENDDDYSIKKLNRLNKEKNHANE